MKLYDLIEIVQGTMAGFADSGNMLRNGAEYFETATELIAVYNQIDYITYQQEGFTHYISKKFIDKNKGFISVVSEGKITRFVQSEILGLPYDKSENNKVLLENQSKMMVEMGAAYNV